VVSVLASTANMSKTADVDIKQASSPSESALEGDMSKINADDLGLNALGYQQHMKRGFTFWSMVAFCLTGLGLLPSLGGTLWFSLGYLGLLPMTWGWLSGAFFIMFEVFALAELSSSMPTAGGLYVLLWPFFCHAFSRLTVSGTIGMAEDCQLYEESMSNILRTYRCAPPKIKNIACWITVRKNH
jgi:hypothetical protein